MRVSPYIVAFCLVLGTAILVSCMGKPDSHPILRVSYQEIQKIMRPAVDHPSYLAKLKEPVTSLLAAQPIPPDNTPPAAKKAAKAARSANSIKKIELNTDSLFNEPQYLPIQIYPDTPEPVTDVATKPQLNLSLPEELSWDDKATITPSTADPFSRLFAPSKNISRFSLSGQIHFDESEEAEELPLEQTILGAELEFQWLLP